MALAGFCSECKRFVWLKDDLTCENGHGRPCIRGVYEAQPQAPRPVQSQRPADSASGVVALFAAAGVCVLGLAYLFYASSVPAMNALGSGFMLVFYGSVLLAFLVITLTMAVCAMRRMSVSRGRQR